MQTKKSHRKTKKMTTQTKSHNANKKVTTQTKKATTQTKSHNANKKSQRKQKSHNASKKPQRKQKSHNANKKSQHKQKKPQRKQKSHNATTRGSGFYIAIFAPFHPPCFAVGEEESELRSLLEYYFHIGYKNQVILDFLASSTQYCSKFSNSEATAT